MNIALILAGGCGVRMAQDVPKQFINVYDKPIILYTLEAFEKHPDIDAIIVTCLDGWQEILRAYAEEDHITKLKWIVTGGHNGQESTKHALDVLKEECGKEDLVIIHDGIRPNISQEIISDAIVSCKRFGSGLAAIRCAETVIETADRKSGNKNVDRDRIMRIQTPHVFPLGKLLWAHEEAAKRGITNATTASSLMIDLGETMHFSMGSEKNVKITTTDDIEIFKALYKSKREEWLK